MNSPLATSCQSRTSVSENGTMKAALVLRPAISQRAMPGEDAEPERRVAADGGLHVCHLLRCHRHSGGIARRRAINHRVARISQRLEPRPACGMTALC